MAALDVEDAIACEIVTLTPATPIGALTLIGWAAEGLDENFDHEFLREAFDAIGRARDVLAAHFGA